ncbi:MAG TPA: hypothetical protein VF559_04885 [Caulobacteraceae bacterium]|jgi:uncharacterized membrane protein
MTTTYDPPRDDGADKALTAVNYLILFIAPFVAGFPSLVAAIIAYVRRGSASPVARSHYDNQIRIFWVGIVLSVLAIALVFAAIGTGLGAGLAGVGELFSGAVGLGVGAVLMLVAAAMLGIANVFWYIIASIIGFIRLLDGRPIGRAAGGSLPTVAA